MCRKSQAMMASALGCQELAPCRPGAAGSRVDTGCGQDLPDRGGADSVAQPGALPLDPAAAPARILPCQPQHQLLHGFRCRRPARPAPALAVVPPACNETSMPTQQRPWCHREHLSPATPGYQRGQCREPQPIRPLVSHGTRKLPAQHRILVPEHEQLSVSGRLPTQQHCWDREKLPRDLIRQ